jgi:hypothetical protein
MKSGFNINANEADKSKEKKNKRNSEKWETLGHDKLLGLPSCNKMELERYFDVMYGWIKRRTSIMKKEQ